jgi:hypothetical protein
MRGGWHCYVAFLALAIALSPTSASNKTNARGERARVEPRSRHVDKREEMDPRIFAFLIIATTLEAFGDAIVRLGINEAAWEPRCALFLAGAFLLFGYGFSLNLAPIEFSRVVGLYIATLFVVWQIVNLIVFRTVPDLPILLGGALIIAGGFIVTFWR